MSLLKLAPDTIARMHKAWTTEGDVTVPEIGLRFGISAASVKKLCAGLERAKPLLISTQRLSDRVTPLRLRQNARRQALKVER